tara:strand:+ start:5838 stop:6392 length:555 start_codon:yes stop_codon:yes gene_type:complete
MKFYIELSIFAILLLLVFDKPTYVTEMSNTMLGKTVLVVAVACVAKYRGLGAGLMAALIMLILLHDGREGVENMPGPSGSKVDHSSGSKVDHSSANELHHVRLEADEAVAEEKDDEEKEDEAVAEEKDDEEKEDKAGAQEGFTTISDVRMTEGMMNMNSYSEGMSSSKFTDGFTGNRPMFNGLI